MEIISLFKFNKMPFIMLRSIFILSLVFFIFSCKEEVALDFYDRSFSSDKSAIMSIIIPEAKGNSSTAKNINKLLEQFACDALKIDASKEPRSNIEESAKQFDESYTNFKKQISIELSQELPIWEANIDGEVTYKNDQIISIAMNSSINTGAAKGNLKIKFFNFDPSTGKLFTINDFVNNQKEFKQLVKKYFDKELLTSYNEGDSLVKHTVFRLPESFGFSDIGIIVFYNGYELAMPSTEFLEFTIPYQVVNDYLTL